MVKGSTVKLISMASPTWFLRKYGMLLSSIQSAAAVTPHAISRRATATSLEDPHPLLSQLKDIPAPKAFHRLPKNSVPLRGEQSYETEPTYAPLITVSTFLGTSATIRSMI